ncbi:hypothetical protein BO78DRAFT_436671 [Aspergillus sclerotiicarbonarius CBS 121057]|uniref:Acyltransferase 3 domain-containing protein n=1 Tax=Aspergillus sclerotiicarbonarius (strain CBS 121057 / IBT 28362) TaxID=1448318 RepID=A0A319EKC6_ASPSB|nr:hypothetical protein BO78DRAFT_436671 [Aspergillus sclerotiicarbonarius CBS 121057]
MALAASATSREHWLDGLRGIAAAIVAWFHFTVGEMGPPYRSFWTNPAEDNRRWFQLPPFRLIFAGQAMVLIFFVISGYAVSISIIRLREEAPAQFYRKLTSSVLRRGFRLYIPVLILCLLSHVALYTGLIDWTPGNPTEGCPGAEPWSALGPHVSCLTLTFLTTLDLSGPIFVTGYNFHLWTISYEFRCSLAVYLVILGLASVKAQMRLAIVACLGVVFLWFGSPMFSAFLTGLLFAELDVAQQQVLFPPSVGKRYRTGLANWISLLPGLLFGIAIFLLCLPQDPSFPPEFWFQSRLALPFYVDPTMRIRAWHAVGAILVVGTLRHLPLVRAPLESKLAQFLGMISFSIYLLHPLFIMVLRNRILDAVCRRLWGTDFWQTRQDESAWHVLFLAWAVAGAIMGPLLVLASGYMARSVDRRSVAFSYQVEKILCGR